MNRRSAVGVTLIELMIAVVVIGVLLTLAAPSLYDFILMQRLKGTQAQLVTDLQFARSSAASGGLDVQVVFSPATEESALSCYTLYTDTSVNSLDRLFKCDCRQAAGARCPQPTTQELRTLQIRAQSGVRLALPDLQATGLTFLATTGAVALWPLDWEAPSPEFMVEASVDANRKLRTSIGLSGRPTVCAPSGTVIGYAAC
jgi:prepilin-type N-terminal cleavage/methylation domain-containing protein